MRHHDQVDHRIATALSAGNLARNMDGLALRSSVVADCRRDTQLLDDRARH